MNGRQALRNLAALERAAITRAPPPPPHLSGPADPAVLAELVAEMTDWDAAYKRDRRRREHDRRRRQQQIRIVA